MNKEKKLTFRIGTLGKESVSVRGWRKVHICWIPTWILQCR